MPDPVEGRTRRASRVAGGPGLREVLADPTARLLATFVLVPRIEIVECLAYAGFEAVVVDLEHAPVGVPDLPPLVAAGHGAGAFVLARLGERSPAVIGAVLDTGVDGIVLPHVSSAEDARAAVDAGRFPPEGSRSLNPYVRGAGYTGGDDFTRRANDGVAILVMVEGRDGVDALDAIAAVSGIDAVFVGPVDLSASLGLTGQPEHPHVVTAVGSILGRLNDHGVAGAVYCPTPEASARWQGKGARLVVLSADIAMANHGFHAYLHGLGELSARDRSS